MTGQEVLTSAASDAPPKPVGEHWWAIASVLILSAATGLVEVVCFAHLGGVFAAFVTGTVMLAGVAVVGGGFGALLPYGVAFAGFLAGGVLGGHLIGTSQTTQVIARTLRALAAEFSLLVLAVIADLVIPHRGGLVALGLLSAGVAVQYSATKHLKVADLGFAAPTGLIHGIAHDFAQGVPARLPRKLLAPLALMAGASVGGFVSKESISAALLIASGLAAVAAVTLATGGRSAGR